MVSSGSFTHVSFLLALDVCGELKVEDLLISRPGHLPVLEQMAMPCIVHYHQTIRPVEYVLQSRGLILNMLIRLPGGDGRGVGFEIV